MLKACIFHWQIFRGDFNAREIKAMKKNFYFPSNTNVSKFSSDERWHEMKDNIIVSLFLALRLKLT